MIARHFKPFAFGILVLALAPLVGRAQPLADRIPADAIVYAGWSGADSMGPGYAGSHLKAILDESQIQRVVNDVIPKLMDLARRQNAKDAEQLQGVADVLKNVWKHPTALYIGPIDMTNPRQPVPRLVLMCDAGEDAAALRDRLESFVQQAGKDANVPVAVRGSGSVVALVVGRPPGLDAVFDGKAKDKSLAGAKSFADAMAVQKSPVLAAYVDVEAVVKFLDEAVARGDDNDAKEKWPAVRDALGLGALKRVSMVEGFEGKEWATHAFIEASAPRKGILSALDAKPVENEVYRAIPSTATMAGVARFDIAGLLDGIRDAVRKLDARGADEMDKNVKQLNDMLGLNVRDDVLAPLGDQWAYYIAPDVSGHGAMGLVLINRLKDPARAEAASDKLKGLANTIIAKEQKDPNVRVAFKQSKVGDVTVHYLATPFVSPSWSIHGGNLYVGLYPQVAAGAAGHVARGGKSILDNPNFLALRKRLGGEKAISFQYFDLPASAPTAYQTWMIVSSFGKVADILGVDTPATMLPPLARLTPHLGVAGGVSWTDDAGWHYRAITPFPGATTVASEMTGSLNIQTTALLAGVLLPSLNNAREQAQRVQSLSNLRQIGVAAHMYANDHKGKFPDEMGDLVEFVDFKSVVFVNPRKKTAPPANLNRDALRRWVNESSDYAYLGKGKRNNTAADVVIAHEKPEGLSDGINLLFADGHVEFMKMPQAMEAIQKAGGER